MMREFLEPGPGFAIIGRFVYPSKDDHSHVQQTDRFDLVQGEGILFTGKKDNPGKPIRFKQSELNEIIQQIEPGTIQLMALVDKTSGGLLFTDLTKENSFGIAKHTPKERRALVVNFGRIVFAGIWGESQEEANQRLKEVIEKKLRLN